MALALLLELADPALHVELAAGLGLSEYGLVLAAVLARL